MSRRIGVPWSAFCVLLALMISGGPARAEDGTLRVGIYDNAPLSFMSESGEPQGVFAEQLLEVARDQDWTLAFIPGPFSLLMEQLASGEIDMLGVVALTRAREATYRFNRETVLSNWAQIYTTPNRTLESLLDLRGLHIAAVAGDVHLEGDEGLRSMLRRLDVPARVTEVASYDDVARLLNQGVVDAGLMNRMKGNALAADFDIAPTTVIFNPVGLHFALAPDFARADEVIRAIDAHLRTAKADPNSTYHGALARVMTGADAYTVNWIVLWIAVITSILFVAVSVVAVVLQRIRKQLQTLALTDTLTGIPNRRAFFESGRREFSRSRRHKHPLAAIMVDADRFKAINDNYGHEAGDRVLEHMAALFAQVLRVSDVYGRLGGEEFAILLPNTNAGGARLTAEKLRLAVEATAVRSRGHDIKFTASFGVVELQDGDRDLDELLARADRAVYSAKSAGRNQVALI